VIWGGIPYADAGLNGANSESEGSYNEDQSTVKPTHSKGYSLMFT